MKMSKDKVAEKLKELLLGIENNNKEEIENSQQHIFSKEFELKMEELLKEKEESYD